MVDADSASVHVSGGDTNQVTVRMSARGSEDDLAKMNLDAFQKGDAVTVTMRRQGREAGSTGNRGMARRISRSRCPSAMGSALTTAVEGGADRFHRLLDFAHLWR